VEYTVLLSNKEYLFTVCLVVDRKEHHIRGVISSAMLQESYIYR